MERTTQITELTQSIDRHGARRSVAALDRYSRVAEMLPGYGQPWRLLDVLALQTNDNQAAQNLRDRAIRIDANDAAVRSALGGVRESAGNPRRRICAVSNARLTMRTLVAQGQTDAQHNLGLLAQLGNLAQARMLIEESISLRPNAALAHFELANVRDLQGDLAGAILAYEATVMVAPDFAEAHSNLGNLYGQTGRRDDAVRAYAAAIRAQPDFAAVYCNLGAVLIDLERNDEAIQALEAALRLAPDIPETHANLGQAYRRSGRFREAIAASRRDAIQVARYLPEVKARLRHQSDAELVAATKTPFADEHAGR